MSILSQKVLVQEDIKKALVRHPLRLLQVRHFLEQMPTCLRTFRGNLQEQKNPLAFVSGSSLLLFPQQQERTDMWSLSMEQALPPLDRGHWRQIAYLQTMCIFVFSLGIAAAEQHTE
jgi:hypothetical protein